MKKYVYQFAIAFTLLFAASCNSDNNKDSKEVAEETNEKKFDDNKAEDDREFLVEAASGGLTEVTLGKLALQNGSSAQVKEFGQDMITDHSKANDELKALAAKKNITIPATPADKHQKMIDELTKKKGADFDKEYMKMMVEDHEEDVSDFQKEANDGKDAEVKAFAAGKVEILQHHLEMAETIRDVLKG